MTLSRFLLARIAEDETRVRDEGLHPGGPDGLGSVLPDWEERRWLAECEAKRSIASRHRSSEDTRGVGQHRNHKWTPYCEYDTDDWPCPDITALASVYSDHPDFREEWR